MKNNKNQNLENLTTDELILVNSILSRPQLETEAIVETIQKNERKPVKDIQATQKQILDAKLKEKEQKIRKAIREGIITNYMLSSLDKWADIDSQLARWDEEKRIADENRAKEAERITQEMERKRKAIEAYERNKFRARYTAYKAKANSLLAQKERVELNAKIAKHEEKVADEKQKRNEMVQNAVNAIKKAQESNVFTQDTTIVKDTAVAPETVTLRNQSNLPKQTNTRSLKPNISRPFITRVYDKAVDLYQAMKSTYNNFIANGRIKQKQQTSGLKGVQAYEKTMNNQPQNTFNATSGNSKKADRLGFTGTYQFKVNEKEAQKKANSQAKLRYEPRTL